MVMLGVENERDLKDWVELSLYDEKHAVFTEPDIGGEMTAIACLPKDPKIFKSLRLL